MTRGASRGGVVHMYVRRQTCVRVSMTEEGENGSPHEEYNEEHSVQSTIEVLVVLLFY